MNPVIEAIKKRRSVRSYEPKPIPRDILNTIIEAGNQAPSAFPHQPWRFVVVEDREFKRKLVQTALPIWKKMIDSIKDTNPESYENAMKRYEEMEEPKDSIYYSAPIIIFVIGPVRHTVDCALACQNIMLAAYSLGLGSCYSGFGSMVQGDADVVKALELKDGERIFGPIVLGYPKDYPEPPEKKAPVVKWI